MCCHVPWTLHSPWGAHPSKGRHARISWSRVFLSLVAILFLTDWPARAASEGECLTGERSIEILAHQLDATLTPSQHRLVVTDHLRIRILSHRAASLSFSLSAALRIRHVQTREGDQVRLLSFDTRIQDEGLKVDPGTQVGKWQCVSVQLNEPIEPGEALTLEWNYEGVIDDPPREPRHLRFVTPSETAGHIGNEGVYLSSETRWYPDRPQSLATYRLRVTLPEGWVAVSQGKETNRQVSRGQDQAVTTEWDVSPGAEALTLVANRFIKAEQNWRDPAGRTVEIAAYLLQENAHLAPEYLDASIRYLEAYTPLLGPYPFEKFAVVENFFASGLGMPSFTLLGSGVIKRRYVQPYALGHEIVHSWLGNWVFNDIDAGNWVEGLTTYLANYYYDELTGKAGEAREQRRMMLLGYAVHVRSDEDYPVGRFRQKTAQRDNAIGYQKAAMIFHMLRREIGEAAFWSGLRKLVSTHGGRHATWSDLERVFTEAGGRDLRWFFAQWVERAGAPGLTIAEAGYRAVPEAGAKPRFAVTVQIRQSAVASKDAPYRLRLPLSVSLANGEVHKEIVEVASAEQRISLSVSALPVALRLDPDFDIFRRLTREQVPPMLNLFVTDRDRSLSLPEEGPDAERAPYRELWDQILSREPAIRQVAGRDAAPAEGSILVLGGPAINPAVEWASRLCGGVQLERDRFTVEGRTYDDPAMALLLSCRRPERPGSVVTLFYGLTPAAAAKVARLLFFYGWHSYLIFRDGAVQSRGDFASSQEVPEVIFDSP